MQLFYLQGRLRVQIVTNCHIEGGVCMQFVT